MNQAIALSIAVMVMTGCSTVAKTVDGVEKAVGISEGAGEYPKNSALIPDATIKLSPSQTFALEKLLFTAAGAALLYYVYDPLAPNWAIEEAQYADDVYRLSMKMKRYHNGGDGEAMRIFKRRATELKFARGYSDFEILEFQEGIESSTLAAQRYSEGIIRLVRANPRPFSPQ